MNFSQFYRACLPLTESRLRQRRDYLDDHAVRFWRTYRSCKRHLSPGARVLSIGAGSAYIETILATELNVSVTLFDFPEMLKVQESFNHAQGFQTIGGDITQYEAPKGDPSFDLILSSEVVEHVPEAPERHIARFRPHLKPGGVFVITTPNFGSFRNLMRFALQLPVLEDPALSFLPPSFLNEQYHRREYMPCEIESALGQCGLRRERVEFTMNAAARSARALVFAPFEAAIPRWRLTQIVTARG